MLVKNHKGNMANELTTASIKLGNMILPDANVLLSLLNELGKKR